MCYCTRAIWDIKRLNVKGKLATEVLSQESELRRKSDLIHGSVSARDINVISFHA